MFANNLIKNLPYYGFSLKDLEVKEILENYKVIWPHVHTIYSLSSLPLNGFKGRFNECSIEISLLLKMADKHNINQIIITDHDAPRMKSYKTNYSPIKGALKAEKMTKENGHKVEIIPGQEILFTPNNQQMSVHILLFPLTEELNIKYKTGTLEELTDYCKANSIKMVAPHPLANESMKFCDKTLLYDPNIPKKIYYDNIKHFDAVSVINALSLKELNMATIYATHDLKNLAKIGECDAHSYEALKLAGTLIPINCSGFIEAIEKRCTIPFGVFGANKELIFSWGRNAYNLVMEYTYYLKKDPDSYHGEGFEIFKQIHGDKFKDQRALMNFIIYLIKVGRYTVFPATEKIIYDHSRWSINHLLLEIIKTTKSLS